MISLFIYMMYLTKVIPHQASLQLDLDLAIKYDIDLVLLDLILPDMSGIDLISLLKHNESTQHVPIVVISALVRKKERDRALVAGCDDYLEKPYFIDDLKQKICQYLPQSFLAKILPQATSLATFGTV